MAFLCKLTMMSDFTLGFLLIMRIERIALYGTFMSCPQAGTQRLVREWQKEGVWEKGVDLAKGEDGFAGFGLFFPYYSDLSYSHSVELMAIVAVLIIAIASARWRISAQYAVAIFLTMISHPLLDMVFHDAYFRMGTRSKSRVSFGLWNISWAGPLAFAFEMLITYVPYRLWLSTRVPKGNDEKTSEQAAMLALCVALAANVEDFSNVIEQVDQQQPEFTMFCEKSGIATDTNLAHELGTAVTVAPKASGSNVEELVSKKQKKAAATAEYFSPCIFSRCIFSVDGVNGRNCQDLEHIQWRMHDDFIWTFGLCFVGCVFSRCGLSADGVI